MYKDCNLKQCSKCKETKELSEFSSNKSRRDGLCQYCKPCKSERAKHHKRAGHPRSEARKISVRNHRNTLKGRYTEVKGGAVKRNISFNLSTDEFSTFWQKPCSYCGSEIATIGIDRIDSAIGYQINNCVPCCGHCNTMKMDYSLDEWFDKMKTILTFKGLI